MIDSSIAALATKQLALRVDMPTDPVAMHTDADKRRQILINLLGNAVKFTDRGEVALSARENGNSAHFEVADTGLGIAPGNLAQIFDPFWQVEQSQTRRYGGTGLGLSLMRTLARALGGDVRVESAPGERSTFFVELPLTATRPDARDRPLSDFQPPP